MSRKLVEWLAKHYPLVGAIGLIIIASLLLILYFTIDLTVSVSIAFIISLLFFLLAQWFSKKQSKIVDNKIAWLLYKTGEISESQAAEFDMARRNIGPITMDGSENTIYLETGGGRPMHFAGAWISLEKMTDGDRVRLRLYVDIDGKGYRQATDDSDFTFDGIQHPALKYIKGDFLNTYGVKITAHQLLNPQSYKVVTCEVYDGKPSG